MAGMTLFEQDCTRAFLPFLQTEGKTLVFGDGNTDHPPLMLIGEAPGEQETILHRPFVGKAGKNLDEFLKLMRMERQNIYVSNVVKFRPTSVGPTGRMRNRAPTKQEIADFLPYLLREIKLVSPFALVTLGNVPLQALMGDRANIGQMHGAWHTAQNGLPLFALYHPAAIIYRRDLRPVYEQDVCCLRDSLTFKTAK